ncbi:MAG: hypothetical protein H0V85_05685 [Thermoleophilaceae bacterium]|nr:hypothetical protein [Thermoleophilaceae bacterium]
MHLRRALLLFAIVLVLVALAASIAAPQREEESAEVLPGLTDAPESRSPRPGGAPRKLDFSTKGRPRTRELDAGAPGRVRVAVTEPGQVEIEGLGRTGAAVPGTPAAFDVLTSSPERHRIVFEPAATDERKRAGTLVITQGSLLR